MNRAANDAPDYAAIASAAAVIEVRRSYLGFLWTCCRALPMVPPRLPAGHVTA